MDRAVFFGNVRRTLFGGRLTSGQVVGMSAILERARAGPGGLAGFYDRRWLAYMLATVHHETGRKMQPVRETMAASDAQAIARLDKAFAAGQLPTVRTPYWRRDAEGKSWLGRGLVQLTHRRNYERVSGLVGIDLVADPARAMDGATAVEILFIGMETGAFTGVSLADVFSAGRTDWVGARRIINGRDRAVDIAAQARAYHAALSAAGLPSIRRISLP
ncbi:hypothetical protein G8E10_24125 [Rhizobiaceae bacterium CRRU44]|uniref:Glycoside hydrolase family 19 catalytic domain-containing protein n=1 Tax=Ferranicluibacter rubi TaxID=2715133 RepID=A0AA43ZKV6_9HYPH|nr:hypothetical protein [Ferranicluibacter rubi]NHT78788.1 hypothetical protein [Ferranicluibacter rubi]